MSLDVDGIQIGSSVLENCIEELLFLGQKISLGNILRRFSKSVMRKICAFTE
jgi:hypothetical protein